MFSINHAMAQIKHGNQTIPLTKAEYLLLKYLIDNPEQILTKDSLLDAIWGQVHSSEPNTITTHIKSIRQKLVEANIVEEHIQTHRGLGYSFRP
jgi:two-component system catabolic regulation response regulator CreB